MVHKALLFFLLLPTLIFCVEKQKPEKCQDTFQQWFTGPLFTPMAITPEKSHPALEVTVGFKDIYGVYDSDWSIKNVPDLWSVFNYYDAQLGISSILGMEIIASWAANFRQGASAVHLQDTTLRVGFQVCNEVPGTWIPDFRIIIQEVFPTGKYQNLNPSKNETDLTGLGSYQTGMYLAFQKLFKLNEKHKYQMRFSAGYFVPAPVHVEGFNAYGGGYGTKGKIYPGHYISIFCSGEYNLNKRWALAFDSNFQYNFKGRFSGKPGKLGPGVKAPIASPEAAFFTLAPELEHTFTECTGMLLGVWFSVFGKNSPAFVSMFVCLLHVF
ncbi:hypothetical protein [Simkania sp.]|uniref:hypothetical protein n=1 Tax=Simkania sp. TaxID=34094 RepID=UPI003B52C7B9